MFTAGPPRASKVAAMPQLQYLQVHHGRQSGGYTQVAAMLQVHRGHQRTTAMPKLQHVASPPRTSKLAAIPLQHVASPPRTSKVAAIKDCSMLQVHRGRQGWQLCPSCCMCRFTAGVKSAQLHLSYSFVDMRNK
ncbi:hypothetical protein AVEN_239841-1 [Araneus ventricosus]|uniref:Uncharacterized protein n=1 Tax=Araneus ventricosus TaxID=182803 RepID=A0A4Y2MXR2_ARAVE|nr:hypothetical protein AVEN_239841-1 [Araneus ventricosus]